MLQIYTKQFQPICLSEHEEFQSIIQTNRNTAGRKAVYIPFIYINGIYHTARNTHYNQCYCCQCLLSSDPLLASLLTQHLYANVVFQMLFLSI